MWYLSTDGKQTFNLDRVVRVDTNGRTGGATVFFTDGHREQITISAEKLHELIQEGYDRFRDRLDDSGTEGESTELLGGIDEVPPQSGAQ